MGKKIQSKKASPKPVKNQNIKKPVLPKSKSQVKNSPKKSSTEIKHSKVPSKKKPQDVTKNTVEKNNKFETKNISPSKKKQTKKSVKKVNKKEQIKKSLGSKKLNIQKKKQQKNQRLLNLDRNQQKKQYNNQITLQKQHQPIFAIYRKQVPQRWRESIIRYHEAKQSQFKFSKNLPYAHQSFLNNQSFHAGQSKQDGIKDFQLNSNLRKNELNPGIKRSQRLKKSKTYLGTIQFPSQRFPQVIEISSSHNSEKSKNNYVSFDFHQNLYSDQSKLEQSYKNSQNNEQSISINRRNITPEKHRIQKQNDSSVSNRVIEVQSKSESKVSYQYQIMSLSQSKQNSIGSKILNQKGKGKKYHNIQHKSQSQQESDKHQSQQNSSHSISPQYTVEKIVSSKIKGGKTFYQIKWVGYPDQQNTLQPIKNLKNIMQMVVDFQKRQKQTYKQTLKQNQKILAQKNKQLTSKNKQLVFKTKKLDDMKKKVQELTKKVKDLQKQKKVFSKIEQQTAKLKNQCNTKSQFIGKNDKIKLQPFGISHNFKIRIPSEQNQKDKISSNSTQVTNSKTKNKPDKNKQVQKNQEISNQMLSLNGNSEKAIKLQIPQVKKQKISEQFPKNNLIIKIPQKQSIHDEDILHEQIMQEEKDQMGMGQLAENMIRIDDFDQGQIHHDLQMVEYSFPFFNTENLDKNEKNRKYLQMEHSIIQEDNLQNQQLIEEYDCLKYLNTDQ